MYIFKYNVKCIYNMNLNLNNKNLIGFGINTMESIIYFRLLNKVSLKNMEEISIYYQEKIRLVMANVKFPLLKEIKN